MWAGWNLRRGGGAGLGPLQLSRAGRRRPRRHLAAQPDRQSTLDTFLEAYPHLPCNQLSPSSAASTPSRSESNASSEFSLSSALGVASQLPSHLRQQPILFLSIGCAGGMVAFVWWLYDGCCTLRDREVWCTVVPSWGSSPLGLFGLVHVHVVLVVPSPHLRQCLGARR